MFLQPLDKKIITFIRLIWWHSIPKAGWSISYYSMYKLGPSCLEEIAQWDWDFSLEYCCLSVLFSNEWVNHRKTPPYCMLLICLPVRGVISNTQMSVVILVTSQVALDYQVIAFLILFLWSFFSFPAITPQHYYTPNLLPILWSIAVCQNLTDWSQINKYITVSLLLLLPRSLASLWETKGYFLPVLRYCCDDSGLFSIGFSKFVRPLTSILFGLLLKNVKGNWGEAARRGKVHKNALVWNEDSPPIVCHQANYIYSRIQKHLYKVMKNTFS